MKRFRNWFFTYAVAVIAAMVDQVYFYNSLEFRGIEPCALDGVVLYSFSLRKLVLPVIMVYAGLCEIKYSFTPNVIVRQKSRAASWYRQVLMCYVKCAGVMAVLMVCSGLMFYALSGRYENFHSLRSIMFDEFQDNGYVMPDSFNVPVMILQSFLINSLELFYRVLAAMAFYWITDSQVFSVILTVAMGVLAPNRMTIYRIGNPYYTGYEYGYTELYSPYLYIKSLVFVAIWIFALLFIAHIAVSRKNFLKRYI